MYIPHIVIHSSIDGHGWVTSFHLLPLVNNAAVNMLSILWGIYPEVELLGHMGILCLILEEPAYCFHSGCTISHFTTVYKSSNFSASSSTLVNTFS